MHSSGFTLFDSVLFNSKIHVFHWAFYGISLKYTEGSLGVIPNDKFQLETQSI